ncbi:MAG: fimbrial protein [Gemmatimonadales bacterium]
MTHSLLKTALAAVLALFFVNQGAWASCIAGSTQTTSVQVPGGGGGKLNIPRNAPVGTTVWTSPTMTLPAVGVACSGQAYGVHATSLPASGVANIYQTDIAYLGLKVVEVTSFTTVNTTATPWTTPAFNFTGSLSPSYQVSLVVIAPVTGNVSSSVSGPIVRDYISDSASALVNARELHRLQLSSFNTQVTGSAPCTASNMTVNLGSHGASEFGGVGSTTAATDFTIELKNCPAGMRRIAYQIDPATTVVPGTGSSVVTLNAGSTATGVGVQLLDGSGAPIAVATQLTVGDSGGSYTIPLKARYYKTAASVGAGSASSAVTFTITYN